jgi:hypothetical protein
MATIEQLQLKRLSPNFLKDKTIVKLYKHLQLKGQNSNMELLISAPLDLFQIDVSYFYKSSSTELNILQHIPMVKPNKLLKFFQFIKFLLYQTTGQNYLMMPNFGKDLFAIGQDH